MSSDYGCLFRVTWRYLVQTGVPLGMSSIIRDDESNRGLIRGYRQWWKCVIK